MIGRFLKKLWKGPAIRFSKNGLLTIFRHTWTLLAVFLVIIAVIFTLFRALTPLVKQYRPEIQQQLSVWTGKEITIRDLQTSWYWFTPVLRLNDVTVGQSSEHLHFKQVLVGIDLLSSLWRRQVQPGVLYVDDAHLKLQQNADSWQIEGLDLSNTNSDNDQNQANILPFIGLLLAQDKVIIKHLSADVTLQDGVHIRLQNLHFKADHHAQNYRLYSQATLRGKPDIQFTMIANMMMDSHDLNLLSGQIYLSVSPVDLSLSQKFSTQLPVQIKQGMGTVSAWIDVVHGRILQTQAVIDVKNVVLQEASRTQPRKISSAVLNLAWQRQSHGWRLSADHVLLHLDGLNWPENAFSVEYREDMADYQGYIKTLPLNLLLKTQIPWPKEMQPILALKPQGLLSDTRLSWQNGTIYDCLTHFSHLTWRHKAEMPGVTGLSGALYWQPTEGQLELNGEHSVITLKKPLLPIDLDNVNLSLDWKNNAEGWRLNVDRLVFSHPNLVLSAAGVLDDLGGNAPNLNLQIDFSAKEAQIWLPYIPSAGLKPKLEAWLKHDIPKIAHASGRIMVAGPMADFPFDNQNGEFFIQSHVSGVNMLINEDWPMNADMDADITVKGRHFMADVHQANLADVMVHQVNISIPDIGHGKELFLLHGKIDAPGEHIKAYVFASPLQSRLARWKALTVKEQIGLELNLEVPLYPESDHVYAKGALDFQQNPIEVALIDHPAEFTGVTGRLEFNEYGLTSGGLEGTLHNNPFTLRVQPLLGPNAGTELRFEGEVDINYIHDLIHHPMFSVMQGRFIVSGLWTVFPDAPDTDKLYLNSSLTGLAIHLPKPFGKPLSSIAPLAVKIDFAPNRRMDFTVNYAQKFTGIFSMQQNAQQNWVTTGNLNWGEGRILKANGSGLRITGVLPEVDLNEWQSVWSKWPKEENSASLLDSLTDINLTIGKLSMSQFAYPNVAVRAHQISSSEWAFNVLHKDLSGEFKYNWLKNNLSAHISQLNTDFFQGTASNSSAKWSPKIEAIPNLSVAIDSLTYKGIDVGKLDFTSETKAGHWVLNNGKLQTPDYEMSFAGDWVEQDNKPTSSFEAQLHLSHLENALERWHVTPVVDARYGQLTFSGQWPSAFYDGTLRKLNGDVALILRDGHISHLDRDTEKKLGLGKLLSIMSLQTIPRRLKLDFSDLAQKGYSFDIFKGSFQIHQGVMSTDDSYIDGPVAFGRMSGDLDLSNRLYDLDLRIFPYITASLPLIATIVGTPVAGVAVWAVSSLASKGMQKISGYTYKISGPWMNPVVQQISIDKSVH
jgi:uncharacterized protein (TIGR02099 family)